MLDTHIIRYSRLAFCLEICFNYIQAFNSTMEEETNIFRRSSVLCVRVCVTLKCFFFCICVAVYGVFNSLADSARGFIFVLNFVMHFEYSHNWQRAAAAMLIWQRQSAARPNPGVGPQPRQCQMLGPRARPSTVRARCLCKLKWRVWYIGKATLK